MVTQATPTLTSAEQRHATARARQATRAERTTARRNARRLKYTARPFNAEQLLTALHAEGTAR